MCWMLVRGVLRLGRGSGFAGVFPNTQRAAVVVMEDGKQQGDGKKGELGLIVDLKGVEVKYGSRTVSSFLLRIFFLFFSFFRGFSLIPSRVASFSLSLRSFPRFFLPFHSL
jgi:hypothetical protein